MNAVMSVWLRNFLYFRKSILITFFWTAFEPMLYLFAIGFSLGRTIGNFEGVSYVQFYVPALLCNTAMMVSYFESTYGGYTKLVYQKTFSTILLAPVSSYQIAIGELLWVASKGSFGFSCVAGVAAIFGALPPNHWCMAFLTLFLTALLFASMGLLAVTIARSYDSFSYTISGVIVPMSLFSGTFFPITDLPGWAQNIVWFLPLTHSVQIVRDLLLNRENPNLWIHFVILISFIGIFSAIGAIRLKNKLEA
jgi:lipooligosaccharide transport system permease protein